MLESNKLVKVVSVAIASMSLLGVSASITQAASFMLQNLGFQKLCLLTQLLKKSQWVQLIPPRMLRKLAVRRLLKSIAVNG